MRKIASIIFLLVFAQPTFAGKHAFVLANSTYDELSNLKNTHADAEAYGEAFEGFGYQVTQHRDLSRKETIQALDAFLNRIQPGDEVAFVYAGHGWSDGQVNYLVPTDASRKASTRVLKGQSFALRNGVTGVLDELESLGVSLTVAIIDACRDNPFEPLEGRRSVGLSRGLTRVSVSKGTFVIFSAGEGQQALDGLPDDPPEQKLSVFTRVFVPHLVSGVSLETAISSAQNETAQLALRSGGHKQHPAYYDQTLGNTCLNGDCLPPKKVAKNSSGDVCDALYQEAKSEKACWAYDVYVKSCPDHIFSSMAQGFMAHSCTEPTPETTGMSEQSTGADEPQTPQTHELELQIQAEKAEDSVRLSQEDRKEIQQRLILLEYDPGVADGIFGDRTRAAISSWQIANGVQVTGHVDSDQISTLNMQSYAAYETFIALQRSKQSSAPKSQPKTKSKPKKPPTKPKPAAKKAYYCQVSHNWTGRHSSTQPTLERARQGAIARCTLRSGFATQCSAGTMKCKEITGG